MKQFLSGFVVQIGTFHCKSSRYSCTLITADNPVFSRLQKFYLSSSAGKCLRNAYGFEQVFCLFLKQMIVVRDFKM